jgi:hypothetical protein
MGTDFYQAVKWLIEGKKVRRKYWAYNSYWHICEGALFWKDESVVTIYQNHMTADDWEIYNDLEKKVKGESRADERSC